MPHTAPCLRSHMFNYPLIRLGEPIHSAQLLISPLQILSCATNNQTDMHEAPTQCSLFTGALQAASAAHVDSLRSGMPARDHSGACRSTLLQRPPPEAAAEPGTAAERPTPRLPRRPKPQPRMPLPLPIAISRTLLAPAHGNVPFPVLADSNVTVERLLSPPRSSNDDLFLHLPVLGFGVWGFQLENAEQGKTCSQLT